MILLNNNEMRNEFLYFVDEVFSHDQLKFLNDFFDNANFHEAQLKSKEVINKEVRTSRVAWLDPTEQTGHIYDELFSLVKFVNDDHYHWNLHFLETVQCGEYGVGGHYKLHTDTGLHSPEGLNRKLSFSIGINDDYLGGEFYIPGSPNQDDEFKLEKNQAVFFPSSMPHAVKPVTQGTRRSLVGWICGPNFV